MGQRIAKRGKKAAGASQSVKVGSLPKAKQPEKDVSHVGRRVSKNFGGEIYDGTVTKFVPKHRLWKIKYDDGDGEEMEWKDLSVALELHEGKNKRKGRKGAKSKKSPAAESKTTPATAKDASPPQEEKSSKPSPESSPAAVAPAVEQTNVSAEAATKEDEVMKSDGEKGPVESPADDVSVMDIGREEGHEKEGDEEIDAGEKNSTAEKAEKAPEAKPIPESSPAAVAPAVEKTDVPMEAAAEEDEGVKNDTEKTQKKPAAEKKKKKADAPAPPLKPAKRRTRGVQKKPASNAPPSKSAKRRTRGVQKKPTPKKARTANSIAALVNSSDPNTFVRRRVAKDFGGEMYFGTVAKYDDAETPAYWHVKYDDGDKEDYSKKDLIKALKYYEVHGKKDTQS